jgi:DNA repair protein RadA/Sms
MGKCPLCGGWQTFLEDKDEHKLSITKEKITPKLLRDIGGREYERVITGIGEFDRLLGGGLVRGEVILVGGEPGIGKSTLLLEVASKLSPREKTLYVSAEESPQQVVLRSKRVGIDFDNLYIVGEDSLGEIGGYINDYGFKFVVVDSIQAVSFSVDIGFKGSVSQIRGCADYLTQIAKSKDVVIFIVGHVTKEGVIAGPKLLEHIVDCVLYFEGEILSNHRILRATKNRFGPTQDFALFEMTSSGLKEVKKITELFLPHKDISVSGSCVVCIIEGFRPILIEIQALVSKSGFGVARRRCLGFDFNRFSLLIAIIEKRLKVPLASEDVFLNVAGGLKINDPAADLGAMVAIISSFQEKEIAQTVAFIGEVGLTGELRRVNNINLRLKEVERVNFQRCIIPNSNLKEVDGKFNLRIEGFSSLKDVLENIGR